MAGPIGDDDDIGGFGSYGNEPGYASSLGRISGKALASNLLRNGIDLTFRNTVSSPDILYLDVTNKRIGINRYPLADLDLNIPYTHGHLQVTDSLAVNNAGINSQGYFTVVGPLNFEFPGRDFVPMFALGTVGAESLLFNENYIRSVGVNANIVLDSAGTGKLVIDSNTLIEADLEVTGNIVFPGVLKVDGTVYLGNDPLDVVVIAPDLSQDIIPAETGKYTLGSYDPLLRWQTIYMPANLDNVDVPLPQYIDLAGTLIIDGNTGSIRPQAAETDLNILPASGNTYVNSFKFAGNLITNTSLNAPINLASTGVGYYKISSTGAVVIPSGTNYERQFIGVGEIRWNTDLQYLEVYNGSEYTTVSGPNFITSDYMEDLSNVWGLILG